MHALEYVAVTQHSGTLKTAESGCPDFGIQGKWHVEVEIIEMP